MEQETDLQQMELSLPKIGEQSEEKHNSCGMKQEQVELSLPTIAKSQNRQKKRVRFNKKVQYYCYTVTCEDHNYDRLIKELWNKHSEITKQIEKFSLMQQNQEPPKRQINILRLILEKLQSQEEHVINCLSGTQGSLVHTHEVKEEIGLRNEDSSQEDILEKNPQEDILENTQEIEQDKSGEEPVITKAMNVAQKMVLAATDKSSTPYIMTELEIIRNEIDDIISTSIQDQYVLANQLTKDNEKTKELLKLTSSKRISEERKWHTITQRVGKQRAEKMKTDIEEIDMEAKGWWKKRQKKLSLAENLMATVNKEQSASCRIQMVTERPELSREIVLVEAAKILSFITVKQPQKRMSFDQWMDEQYYVLTTKMTTAQADSVMEEVYSKLNINKA